MNIQKHSIIKTVLFFLFPSASVFFFLYYEPASNIVGKYQFSKQKWERFQDYTQKSLLEEILVKDQYLAKINESGQILDFKNGSIDNIESFETY